jgi:PIN domain nuclease of toxin-antitoxin system
MKLLLDTHAFLWFIEGNANLSGTARSLSEDQGNQRFLSIASCWEMSIKVSIGGCASNNCGINGNIMPPPGAIR